MEIEEVLVVFDIVWVCIFIILDLLGINFSNLVLVVNLNFEIFVFFKIILILFLGKSWDVFFIVFWDNIIFLNDEVIVFKFVCLLCKVMNNKFVL